MTGSVYALRNKLGQAPVADKYWFPNRHPGSVGPTIQTFINDTAHCMRNTSGRADAFPARLGQGRAGC